MDEEFIGYKQALARTLGAICPLEGETLPLAEVVGRVTAGPLDALVDCPSADVSLKDGYAVRAADVAGASEILPVRLRLDGSAAAGTPHDAEMTRGSAVRVLSGAMLPRGADGVVPEELTEDEGATIRILAEAGPGRNILRRGADVKTGDRLLEAGMILRPAHIGLLAAAGHAKLPVVRKPRVGIIATGDEIVLPGGELHEGEIYASNMSTLAAWCAQYGFPTRVALAADDPGAIQREVERSLKENDLVLTIGGAWRSTRDLMSSVFDRLNWGRQYHHVRMGPGKAVGFGLWRGKPVFCLPGGPPSSQMAFLQLALPALLKLAGLDDAGLPTVVAQLAHDVSGQVDWTHFIEGYLCETPSGMQFHPRKLASRLRSMAEADGFVKVPEGVGTIRAGRLVSVQCLPGALPLGKHVPPSIGARRVALPPVVSFVAKSGSGKTTFLERLIPELAGRGLQVGVLKHHFHPTPFDVPGKDTYRMAQAGARIVVGACSVQVAVFCQEDGSEDLDTVIEKYLHGMDLVLTEGYKRGRYPKIEVHRAEWQKELLCRPHELLALVTDEAFDNGVPQFSINDAAGVADFLSMQFLGKNPPPRGIY